MDEQDAVTLDGSNNPECCHALIEQVTPGRKWVECWLCGGTAELMTKDEIPGQLVLRLDWTK